MSRPRTPTAVLEAKGAFAKNPQRKAAREREPEPNGPIGDPPDYFNTTHITVWEEFVAEAPPGVLTQADRKQLELAVRLTCKMRFEPCRMVKWLRYLGDALKKVGMPEEEVDEMKEAMETALGCTAGELALLAQCLQRMGMTPADRSKVHGSKPTEKQDDPLGAALQQLANAGARVQ